MRSNLRLSVLLSKPSIQAEPTTVRVAPFSILAWDTAAQTSPLLVLSRT